MRKIILEQDKKAFVENTIDFMSKEQWTTNNLLEAIDDVVEHMENNAVLNESARKDEPTHRN